MCTFVETADLLVLLDAGVSLCPKRFGFPPHPEEFNAIAESRRRIAQAARKSDVITISHYHFDHHTPSFEDWLSNWTERRTTAMEIYAGKTLLMKDPRMDTNPSQRRRAWMFERTGGKFVEKSEYADGKTYRYKGTTIRFSEPVFHGPDESFLGWILMTTIQVGEEKFMFAPDVQGPISTRTLDLIEREDPDLLLIGGPPSYLSQSRLNERELRIGFENLANLARAVPHIIVEHHLLRDEKWREQARNIFAAARDLRHKVVTAAEFLDEDNQFLEAQRRQLFEKKPPSKEFEKWVELDDETKKHVKPPILNARNETISPYSGKI